MRFDRRTAPGENGCIVWLGLRTARGYGRFSVRRRMDYAHRFAYERSRGPIPAGLQIDHLCRNTACVNPAHLDLVTTQENRHRARGYPYVNLKPHCRHGHSYGESVRRDAEGRICPTCSRGRWLRAGRAENTVSLTPIHGQALGN